MKARASAPAFGSGPIPVLELLGARPRFEEGGMSGASLDLRLNPGECALIECRDAERARTFADLCSGLTPLSEGAVRCLGLDWTELRDLQAWALRGRIGRVTHGGAWVDLYGMHLNILLPQLHHTRVPMDDLVMAATQLSERFGLPGLPVLPPSRLSELDRQRGACVRAFLGRPELLLLEQPVEPSGARTDGRLGGRFYVTFLEQLTEARARGCAVVWLVERMSSLGDYEAQATHRLRLLEEGLVKVGRSDVQAA